MHGTLRGPRGFPLRNPLLSHLCLPPLLLLPHLHSAVTDSSLSCFLNPLPLVLSCFLCSPAFGTFYHFFVYLRGQLVFLKSSFLFLPANCSNNMLWRIFSYLLLFTLLFTVFIDFYLLFVISQIKKTRMITLGQRCQCICVCVCVCVCGGVIYNYNLNMPGVLNREKYSVWLT